MRLALRLAKQSDCTFRHGAVLLKGGRVIAAGHNVYRNHPRYVSPEHIRANCTIHAEESVLRQVADARRATLYVARLGKRGNPMLSKPCLRCWDLIRAAGVTKVIFTS